MLFRKLTEEEEVIFRQWARDNYKPSEPMNELWHPVVQDECRRMNEVIEESLAFVCEQSEH